MKRTAWAPALLALAVPFTAITADARATFDASKNGLVLGGDALRAYDFETAESLVGLELTSWAEADGFPALDRHKIMRPEEVAKRLTTAVDAIEGSHAMRLGAEGTGLAIRDKALFASVADQKVEVTLWVRGDGQGPLVQVSYDRDPENVYAEGAMPFALVRAVRTGRETTDGWAELSTGPLDGSVWGAPINAILVLPSYYAERGTTFLVDALEIRGVAGKPMEAKACTQQTVETTCGPEGDCMFGHCVTSNVTWGVLPPLAHRTEMAERWVQFGTRLIGDRNAARHGATILAPGARAAARDARSSRQFFGSLSRFVNLLRDNHTSLGSPANYTNFAPQITRGSSSAIGACFGVVEKDILGGGLGYAVFNAVENPLTGVRLQRGDVVVAIDGRDPRQWVDELWPQFATTLPNDPASDWGASANDLARLITTRATNVTLARCASAADCTGANRTTITVDVSKVVYEAVQSPVPANVSNAFACTQRFTDAVAGQRPSFGGEDVVATAVGGVGETRVQFDGFVGQGTWESSMTSVFQKKPERVLMDARMGHGGYYSTVEHLFHLLRGTSEPMGVFSAGRGTYDMTDPPWLVSGLGECASGDPNSQPFWSCFAGSANGFFSSVKAPPGASTKIAWLNTYDVSANDFMPRLLQHRTNFRIFAPHPTSGAFGAVVSVPAIAAGWSGGSIQIQDARFAENIAAIPAARWESGHGVPPDELVVQKLSDALSGTDTILQAASAWLAAP